MVRISEGASEESKGLEASFKLLECFILVYPRVRRVKTCRLQRVRHADCAGRFRMTNCS